MINVEEVRKLLESEYGIKTEEELNEAIRKMKPVDIGLFVSPLRKEEAVA
jgi:hypothetical protein